MKAKKDAVLPGLRVTSEFAERARHAMEILGGDLSEVRRKLWEDYIRIADSGETLSNPPRLLTASEDRVLKTYLDWHGISNAEAFFRECAIALEKATAAGKKIQWPPVFTQKVPDRNSNSRSIQSEFRDKPGTRTRAPALRGRTFYE
jgi:hypothetical protein